GRNPFPDVAAKLRFAGPADWKSAATPVVAASFPACRPPPAGKPAATGRGLPRRDLDLVHAVPLVAVGVPGDGAVQRLRPAQGVDGPAPDAELARLRRV